LLAHSAAGLSANARCSQRHTSEKIFNLLLTMLKRLTGSELERRIPQYKVRIQKLWKIFWYGLAAIPAIFILISFTNLPTIEELENPKSELASSIFGSNGKEIGRFYTENRVPVTFKDLSPHLVKALIATEDERFFDHCGIDFRALGRVFFKTFLLGQRSSGGASTITQQLAKLLFTEKPGSGIARVYQKLQEWVIALRLERRYTKEEIIAMYLNKFDFLYDSDGIKAASETYFGKNQKDLKLEEAAVLVGMLKNPSRYNPRSRLEHALQRRNVVFYQMYKNGLLSEKDYTRYKALPLDMNNFQRSNHAEGIATYFRMELGKLLKFDILEREECRKPNGSKYDIYRDGLKIYTTIEPDLQAIAERVMLQHMTKIQKEFFRTWKNLDPWTYETESETEVPIEKRADILQKIIRSSDRYLSLRDHYLSTDIALFSKEIDDLTISDWEIDQIIAEEKNKGALARLVAQKTIDSKRAAKLGSIQRSKSWPALRQSYLKLQHQVEVDFKTPVPMRVFAYNETLEKDTVMSPLDSIRYHRMFLQTGILGVDPGTGQVKVWVGGINHKYFQFDHVTTNRQVGSTFKPFIYSTAINLQGISPCFQVYDQPQTISPGEGNFKLIKPWTPRNAKESYTGRSYTLFEGLKKSINTISVFLMKQLGDTQPVLETIKQMGIDPTKVPNQPSICLGSCDLTVMDMAGAYTTFANNGVSNKPIFITRIEDKNGKVIYQQLPEEKQALSPNANYVMVEMLRYAVRDAGGFAGVKTDFGGKTGTTNDYTDGWFVGLTPSLVMATWVGGEDRWIHFRSLDMGQGAYMARPIFAGFLQEVEKNPELDFDTKKRFTIPPGDLGIAIDCSLYKSTPSGDGEFDQFDFMEDQFGDEYLQDTTKKRRPVLEPQF
jgi:penicillin-binding protein 1A